MPSGAHGMGFILADEAACAARLVPFPDTACVRRADKLLAGASGAPRRA